MQLGGWIFLKGCPLDTWHDLKFSALDFPILHQFNSRNSGGNIQTNADRNTRILEFLLQITTKIKLVQEPLNDLFLFFHSAV